MVLTLEVVGQQASKLGASVRKVFSGSGGTIGRVAENDWVLPDPYISSKHARIEFRSGTYFLVDTSTNGVFLNSQDNRLTRSQPYPLANGDRFFIDAYEIRVSIAGATTQSPSPLSDLFGTSAAPISTAMPGGRPEHQTSRLPSDPFGGSDPFGVPAGVPMSGRQIIPDDPFGTGSRPAIAAGGSAIGLSDYGGESVDVSDPLKLLGLDNKPVPPQSPRAEELAGGSPLSAHYVPPKPVQPTSPVIPANPFSGAPAGGSAIPDDYDPLSDAALSGAAKIPAKPVTPPPAQNQQTAAPRPTPGGGRANVTNGPRAIPTPPPVNPPAPPSRPPVRPQPTTPIAKAPSQPVDAAATGRQLDLTSLLTGAGLNEAQITPELIENFGRVLRVVVAGLMDVLRARERIKDEFRMRMTTFKAMDNNPLKFSANVDDALHNLLVKRNAAYLGPVEAFEDAFQDVRNHQMAMLAGVRVAFEAMLSEFDPERLREQFDKHVKKGGLLSGPAKLRYWEMYNDKFRGMVNDQESTFRDLFGEEFARAYEEQLERLKAVSRSNNKP
jgi:type VI secretion system protein